MALLTVAALAAASASAQTTPATPPASPARKPTMAPAAKISGILECEKSERTSLEVGDAPDHALSIGRTPCRWTQAFVLGRLRAFKGESTSMRDMKGEAGLERGYHVGRTGGKGDVYYFRFDGMIRPRDRTLQGRWSFTGGTGELEGLQGAGTYKGTFDEKGGSKIEMEGEYRLRTPAASEATP
jgi:hypothetical protein